MLKLYMSLRSKREGEIYTELRAAEAKRGTAWWKIGVWRMKITGKH
jgi:hypothetical protein